MGILSEENPVIEELTADQFLRLSGKLYHLDPETIEQRTGDLLYWFFEHPEEVKDKRLFGFSTGMKKKVGLIAAVLHTPDLLILDEPFSGLDPLAVRQCVEFINLYRNEYRTIFIASHDLSYVEQVATHVVVLDQQQFVFKGTLNDFTANGSTQINSALLGYFRNVWLLTDRALSTGREMFNMYLKLLWFPLSIDFIVTIIWFMLFPSDLVLPGIGMYVGSLFVLTVGGFFWSFQVPNHVEKAFAFKANTSVFGSIVSMGVVFSFLTVFISDWFYLMLPFYVGLSLIILKWILNTYPLKREKIFLKLFKS